MAGGYRSDNQCSTTVVCAADGYLLRHFHRFHLFSPHRIGDAWTLVVPDWVGRRSEQESTMASDVVWIAT
jgi:hypothetical protein